MHPAIWFGFLLLVTVLVLLDLGLFHRGQHIMSPRQALMWTMVWVVVALLFNGFVYLLYQHQSDIGWLVSPASLPLSGADAAAQFFTGYILEKSLSIDNLFVIAMIFSYFRIPQEYQHRLLFWGIFGAVVLRGIMIGLGAVLIARFSWTVYVFGCLLLASAAKMLVTRQDSVDVEHNWAIRLLSRCVPFTQDFAGGRLLARQGGQWAATPLALALILIETSDIMFAIDSIPAVFAVTQDPFLVYTSNVFAILGLRSLYFVLAAFIDRFRYLKVSLVFVLAYVGVKMLLAHHYPIPNGISLAMIAGIISVGVLASILANRADGGRSARS